MPSRSDTVQWTLRCSKCGHLRAYRRTNDVMFPAVCVPCRRERQQGGSDAANAIRQCLTEAILCPEDEHSDVDERRVFAYMETIQRRLERQAETWRAKP